MVAGMKEAVSLSTFKYRQEWVQCHATTGHIEHVQAREVAVNVAFLPRITSQYLLVPAVILETQSEHDPVGLGEC